MNRFVIPHAPAGAPLLGSSASGPDRTQRPAAAKVAMTNLASTATLTGLATPAGVLVDTLTPECHGTECNKRSAYCRKQAFVQ